MNKVIWLVGIGGFIGSISRYGLWWVITKNFSNAFPIGTFAVNVLGCLLIGILYGLSEHYKWFNASWNLLLVTGFCGGFTTFSTFALENVKQLQTGAYLHFFLYTIASIVVGLLAVWGGISCVKMMAG